ncbi:NCS2 family permease [Desulfovibrio sp. OttesenSCG-928-F20]|nr:NCS2 family permease [Desulfovibrio sp. OttesenSCG-928-F20]
MADYFHLEKRGSTASKEILCGMTTFLTMSYILFVNPSVLSSAGMPSTAVFVATALAAAICSIVMGLVANTPFGMAPGMGLNTFFAYVVCAGMGFHWREALAMIFLTGILHVFIMATGLRKSLVNAIPPHLKLSFGMGLGIFISYIGLKSAGFLIFTTAPGQFEMFGNGAIISNSSVVPGLVRSLSAPHVIALVSLAVMMLLLALEKKTNETYAALPVGILAATFVGIPLQVTDIIGVKFINLSAVLEIKEVCLAFFGDPGLLSLASSPEKLLRVSFVLLILLVTNVMDSVGTIIGIGQMQNSEIFSEQDMQEFDRKKGCSRLDKTLLSNSFGCFIAPLFGSSTVTTFMESITGIVAGGRTGLTSLTVGVMFLLCLPLANFISIIPAPAIAPALIVAGAFMIPLAGRINWNNYEEAFPAFITAICIPLTYGIVYGIAAGAIAHVLIQIFLGKWRSIHPMLYLISGIFLLIVCVESWV